MLRSALLAILVLGAVGCTKESRSHTLALQPGYVAGEYAIKTVTIQPATSEMAMDPEYVEAERRIREIQQWDTYGAGKLPEVNLLVSITDVSLAINAGRALLTGDHYRIAADLELREIATGKLVARDSLRSMTDDKSGQFGWFGLVMESTQPESYRESEKNRLIKRFVNDVMQYVTTGRLAWIRNKPL